jgi:hypothetical protein
VAHNDLAVFALPVSLATSALSLVRTIKFHALCGQMAFTGATAIARFLVVIDGVHEAVHVVDVVHGKHVGYVAAPGCIRLPMGVAAHGTKVAVSMWQRGGGGAVCMYEGEGTTWTSTRMVHCCLSYGLRFTADGTGLVVAGLMEAGGCSVSLLCAKDGSFVRHLATGLCNVISVEECEAGRWALASWDSDTVVFVGGTSVAGNFKKPSALAYAPGLGLLVRDNDGVQLFATVDAIAMAAMSVMKTTWMATVLRGAIGRL